MMRWQMRLDQVSGVVQKGAEYAEMAKAAYHGAKWLATTATTVAPFLL